MHATSESFQWREMQVVVLVSRYRTTQSSGASEARPFFGLEEMLSVSMCLASAKIMMDVYARLESTESPGIGYQSE